MDSPLHILIVEDEAIIALHLQMQLTKAGYSVEIATTAEQALKKVDHQKPHLLLLDKGLPGKMDGIELARHIQAKYQIPMIVMTGYQEQNILHEIETLKPLACLIKPIQVEQLKKIIQTYLTSKEN